MPQLNITSFPSQLFWLMIVYGLMLFLLQAEIVPRIQRFLRARASGIASDLACAKKAAADAEEMRALYDEKVAKTRSTASEYIQETAAAIESAVNARHQALNKALATQADEAEKRIQANKQLLQVQVIKIAEETARALYAACQKNYGLTLDRASDASLTKKVAAIAAARFD